MRSNSIVGIILIEDAVESDGQKLDLWKEGQPYHCVTIPKRTGAHA
jgi:hypothetical protein